MVEETGPARWPMLLAAIALGYLVVAVFFPILGFEFVDLDVTKQVVRNPQIQGLSVENLKRMFTSWCVTSYYPIRTFSYAVDYQIGGLSPKGFKLSNLLIHLSNVLLVFWLILRLYRHPAAGNGSTKRWWNAFVAAFSAGVFAIHPVVVEPVVWVAGREELLMALGALGCLHFHLSARRFGEQDGKKPLAAVCHAGAALCCAVACLSNAVAAVIPLLIVAWDLLTLARPRFRRILYGTSALWVISGATIVLKKLGQRMELTDPDLAVVSLERLMRVLNVYWLNLKTLAWPTQLTIDYPRVTPQGFLDVGVVLGGIAVGLTCVVLWMLRRRTWALFGLVWFALALAPSSQIVPHHLAQADRFLYLPLAGLSVAVAAGLRPLGSVLRNRLAAGVVIAAGLFGLVGLHMLSAPRIQTWRDSLSLWTECLRTNPNNAFAHACLAENLSERGRFDQARHHFWMSLLIDPERNATLNKYASRLATWPDERLRDYKLAIQLAQYGCEQTEWSDSNLRRTLALAYMNFATTLSGDRRFDLAIENYNKAIAADPDYEVPLFNLALLLATCSEAHLRQPDEAVRLAERGCQLIEGPDPRPLGVLAEVYAQTGRLDQAIATVQQAIEVAQAFGDSEMIAELKRHLERYRVGRPSEPSSD